MRRQSTGGDVEEEEWRRTSSSMYRGPAGRREWHLKDVEDVEDVEDAWT